MNIQVTARHFNASAVLQENLRQEVESMAKYNDSIHGAHVILDAQNNGIRRAEIVINIAEKVITAHADEENMHKAIEAMFAKAMRQLKKEKEKMKVHKSAPVASLVEL